MLPENCRFLAFTILLLFIGTVLLIITGKEEYIKKSLAYGCTIGILIMAGIELAQLIARITQ